MKVNYLQEILIWAGLIRDIGLILGIPTVIIISTWVIKKHIESLKAQKNALSEQNNILRTQIELLEKTQYPRVWSIIEAQKNIMEEETKFFKEQTDFFIKEKHRFEAEIKELNIEKKIQSKIIQEWTQTFDNIQTEWIRNVPKARAEAIVKELQERNQGVELSELGQKLDDFLQQSRGGLCIMQYRDDNTDQRIWEVSVLTEGKRIKVTASTLQVALENLISQEGAKQ